MGKTERHGRESLFDGLNISAGIGISVKMMNFSYPCNRDYEGSSTPLPS